jgi:hypothetical protein
MKIKIIQCADMYFKRAYILAKYKKHEMSLESLKTAQ